MRSWNSVWLGMMNAMFATPTPNSSPSTSGTDDTLPIRNTSTPNAVYAAMMRRPLRTRAVISPSVKPPIRLPRPIAVSMKA